MGISRVESPPEGSFGVRLVTVVLLAWRALDPGALRHPVLLAVVALPVHDSPPLAVVLDHVSFGVVPRHDVLRSASYYPRTTRVLIAYYRC